MNRTALFSLVVGTICSFSPAGRVQTLVNGDFEDGFTGGVANGWSTFASSGYSPDFFDGTQHVRGGSHAQQVVLPSGSDAYAGISQQVSVPVGRRIRIRAWQYKEWAGNPWEILSTIAVERNGAAQWDHPDVFIAEIADEIGAWRQVTVEVRSDTGVVTIWLRTQFKWPLGGSAAIWWDDIAAEDVGPATPPSCSTPARDGWTRFEQLPYPKDGVIAGSFSSHDKSGENGDGCAYFPYGENDRKILLDVKGPGAITDLWFTGTMPVQQLEFSFDDQPAAEIDLPVLEFFNGESCRWIDQGQVAWTSYPVYPYTAPLNRGFADAGGGFVSNILFPFQSRGRLANENHLCYYVASYHRYEPGTPIQTYTVDGYCEELEYLRSILSTPEVDPKSTTGNQEITGTVNVSPGESGQLALLTGAGHIAAVHVDPNPGSRDVLENAWLEIRFDGRAPNVFVPLGYFFGCGFGERDVRAMGVGMSTTGEYYCYFPMPFWESATVRIVNQSSAAVTMPYRLVWNATPYEAHAGYFSADFSPGSVITLDASGTYLGCVCTVDGDVDDHRAYLEGDERVYVDGDWWLTHYGTGTEDFFHGGWYYETGEFSNATHGCPYIALGVSGRDLHSQYRVRPMDYIPFRRGMTLDLEEGPNEGVPAGYAMISYAYRRPVDSMEQTDYLNVGDPASESAHGYSNQGQTWSGSLTSRFEGGMDHLDFTFSGRAFTGQCSFNASIDPENTGVFIRRLLDHATHGQEADVYVDDQLVGRWYSFGENTILRWREDGIMIPRQFTSGKSSIAIRIANVNPAVPFTEFYYEVFSRYHFHTHDVHLQAEDQPGTTTSGPGAVSEDIQATRYRWSGDRHLRFTGTGVGQWVQWPISIPDPGKYLISCGVTTGLAYGKARMSIDGTDVGGEINMGGNTTAARQTQTMGIMELAAGSHIVRFRVTDSGRLGIDDLNFNKVRPIATGSPPVAVAVADPTSGDAPLLVNFDGTGSWDPDGDPLTYHWDFGDNEQGSGATVSHVYENADIYTATLTVYDGNGGFDTDEVVITVSGPPPPPDPLVNGDFEGGVQASGAGEAWTPFATSGYAASYTVVTDVVHGGTQAQRINAPQPPGSDRYAGVLQVVETMPGGGYTVSAWSRTSIPGGGQYDFIARLGTDLTGGTDFQSGSVTWHEFDSQKETWHQLTRQVTATGPSMTIFLQAWRKWAVGGDSWAWFDDAEVVLDTPPPQPTIAVSPSSLNPTTDEGSSPASDEFSVRNSGDLTLNYSITDDVEWLSAAPSSGASTGETDAITVQYATSPLPAGTYNATITVADPNATNNPQTVSVNLTVNEVAPPSYAGDLDGDDDVDQEDFGLFQACLTGDGVPQPAPACAPAKLDEDSDVDQDDFAILRACLSGANITPPPGCLN